MVVQSSCTKPELDTEGAEMECMQGVSHLKFTKPLSGNMDIEKQEGFQNLDEKVQASNVEADGKFFCCCYFL